MATAIEYGLIAAGVAVAIMIGINAATGQKPVPPIVLTPSLLMCSNTESSWPGRVVGDGAILCLKEDAPKQ